MKPTNLDEYIASAPKEAQEKLHELRKLIKEEIPLVEEAVSYGVGAFKVQGKYVVYIAGYKKHVSLYPASDAMEEELSETTQYRTGKGTLQFQIDKPLPTPLIQKIVRFMIKNRQIKESSKKKS